MFLNSLTTRIIAVARCFALSVPCLIILTSANSFAASSATLVVHAIGFENTRGKAIAKLFKPGDNVLGRGRWQRSAKITLSSATFSFSDLEPGSYAIVIFHDENANGEIDHSAIKLPTESLGFSNNFLLGITSGLPNFGRLKFSVDGPKTSISVPMD